MKPGPPASIALLALLAAAGCESDFTPESYLADLRVLALSPAPAEVGPGESVTLAPTVYATATDPVTVLAWSFCPLSRGSGEGFACVVPTCETPLLPGPGGEVTADPSALALACLATTGGSPPPGFEDGEIPEVIDTVFRLRVESVSGLVREAVARVPLHTGAPPASRNLSPIITSVALDGAAAAAGEVGATVAPGGKVRVTVNVDPASIQTYLDGTGRTVAETVVVWFYSSAGRLDDPRDSAPVAETVLVAKELEAGQDEAEVWVVARDLRGGEAIAGPYRVAIAP